MSAWARSVLRFAIPPKLERERHTAKTVPLLILTLFPLLLASYIRLRHPRLPLIFKLIVLLGGLPIISHISIKYYFASGWFDPNDGIPYSRNYLSLNCGMALSLIGLRFIDVLLLGKDSDFDIQGWQDYYSRLQSNGNGKDSASAGSYTIQRPACMAGTSLPLEVDLALTARGQGYKWESRDLRSAKRGYVALTEAERLADKPSNFASEQKWSRIRRLAISVLPNYIVMDILSSLLKDGRLFPPSRILGGGPLAEAEKGALGSFGPFVVTVSQGILTFAGLQFFYGLAYLSHLLVTPAARISITVGKWDPLPFYRPYAATSLSSFWSKHWHGLVRRSFTLFAYNPVLAITRGLVLPRKVGHSLALIATFALSGLLHEVILETQQSVYFDSNPMNGHINLRGASLERLKQFGFGAKGYITTYAFVAQALFIILEQFFLDILEPQIASGHDKKVVRGRARIILGWLWTYSCMIYSGRYIVDLWYSHGLVNAEVASHVTLNVFDYIHGRL